jgi:hypothetical protein
MSEAEFIEAGDPEEAFAALGDETRMAILRALWDPDNLDGGDSWPALTFSELREAVGMRDSGQFNYHLDKLRGVFVRETERGYTLTTAGRTINGAVLGGAFTLEGAIEPIPLESQCPICGSSRELRYENERVQIVCTACSIRSDQDVPPGVLEGLDRSAVPAVAIRYFQSTLQQLGRGFCSFCDGRLETELVRFGDLVPEDPPEEIDLASLEAWRDMPMVSYRCHRCAGAPQVDLGTAVLDEPAVVSFFHDHGIDVRDPDWWLERASAKWEEAGFTDAESTGAFVVFEAGDEQLRVTVDEDLTVVDSERTSQ